MAQQLFDYFVIVGLVPLPPSPDQEDDAITFVPQVIDRYPLDEATERCGYELPPTLPFFAMPEGALRTSECTGGGSSSQKSSRNKKPLDRFFTFVLTDGGGASYYGGCLERFFPAADGTAMPRAACVLSRVPAFMAFRDVLVRLHVLTGGVAPIGATAPKYYLSSLLTRGYYGSSKAATPPSAAAANSLLLSPLAASASHRGVRVELRLTVPLDATAGDLVAFALPGNRRVKVAIPAGASPGSVFVSRVPPSLIADSANPAAAVGATASAAATGSAAATTLPSWWAAGAEVAGAVAGSTERADSRARVIATSSTDRCSTSAANAAAKAAPPARDAALEVSECGDPLSQIAAGGNAAAEATALTPAAQDASATDANAAGAADAALALSTQLAAPLEEAYGHQLLRAVFGSGPLGLDLGEATLAECSACAAACEPGGSLPNGSARQHKQGLRLSDGGGASSARAMAAFWASPAWDDAATTAFAAASGQPQTEAGTGDEAQPLSRRRSSGVAAEAAARGSIDPWSTLVAVVVEVLPGSAAAALGVEVGDVLLQVSDAILGRDHSLAALAAHARRPQEVPQQAAQAEQKGGEGVGSTTALSRRRAYAGPVTQAVRCIERHAGDGGLSMTFLKRRPRTQASSPPPESTMPAEVAGAARAETQALTGDAEEAKGAPETTREATFASEATPAADAAPPEAPARGGSAPEPLFSAPVGTTCCLLEVPLEHVVAHLVDHSQLPPRGTDLVLDASGTAEAAAADAGRTDTHIWVSDVVWGYGSGGAFRCLPFLEPACAAELAQSVATVDVVASLECLLLEQRLCVVADDVAQLTPVCEALRGLLAPLAWQHCYIPLLPTELLGYLEAPIPYVIGLDSAHLRDPMVVDALAASGATTLRLKPSRGKQPAAAALATSAATAATGSPANPPSLREGHPGSSSSETDAAPLWTAAFQPPPDEPPMPTLPPALRARLVARLDLCLCDLRVDVAPDTAADLPLAASPLAALEALEERATQAADLAAASEAATTTAPPAKKSAWMSASSAFSYSSSSSSKSSTTSSGGSSKGAAAAPQWLHPLSLTPGLASCAVLEEWIHGSHSAAAAAGVATGAAGAVTAAVAAAQERRLARVWRARTEAAQCACLLAWAELLRGHTACLRPASAAPGTLGPDGVTEANACFHGFDRVGFLAQVRSQSSKEAIFSPAPLPTPPKALRGAADDAKNDDADERGSRSSGGSGSRDSLPASAGGVVAAAQSAVEAARAKLASGAISPSEFEAIREASAALTDFQSQAETDVARPLPSPERPTVAAAVIADDGLAFLEASLGTQLFEAFIEAACDDVLGLGDKGSSSSADTVALFSALCCGPALPAPLASFAPAFNAAALAAAGDSGDAGGDGSHGGDGSLYCVRRPEVWAPVAAPLTACWFAYRTLPRLDRAKLRGRAPPQTRTRPPLRLHFGDGPVDATPAAALQPVATATPQAAKAAVGVVQSAALDPATAMADAKVPAGATPDAAVSTGKALTSSYYSISSASLSSASISKMYRSFGSSRQHSAPAMGAAAIQDSARSADESALPAAAASHDPPLDTALAVAAVAVGGNVRIAARRPPRRASANAWRASTDARSLADRSNSVASQSDEDDDEGSLSDEYDLSFDDKTAFVGGGVETEAPPPLAASETDGATSLEPPSPALAGKSGWRSMTAMLGASTAKSNTPRGDGSSSGSIDNSGSTGIGNSGSGSGSDSSSGAIKVLSSSSWSSVKSASALSYKASVAVAASTYSASVAAATAASKASKDAYVAYGKAKPGTCSAADGGGGSEGGALSAEGTALLLPVRSGEKAAAAAAVVEERPSTATAPSPPEDDTPARLESRSGKEPPRRRRKSSASLDNTNAVSTTVAEGLSLRKGSLWQRSILKYSAASTTSRLSGVVLENETAESAEAATAAARQASQQAFYGGMHLLEKVVPGQERTAE